MSIDKVALYMMNSATICASTSIVKILQIKWQETSSKVTKLLVLAWAAIEATSL